MANKSIIVRFSFKYLRTARQALAGFVVLSLSVLPTVSVAASDTREKAPVLVTVGFTPMQPPFALDHKGSGLVEGLLSAMAQETNTYKFVAVPLYAVRTKRALKEGSLHLMAFQNKTWGFDIEGVQESAILVEDRGAYFQLLENTKPIGMGLLGATRGFHYAFADFSIEKLHAMENVFLAVDEFDVVSLVQHKRVDHGVASESLLRWYRHEHPVQGKGLRILDQSDGHFERMFVILPNSPIRKVELDDMLRQLKAQGALLSLFAQYGLVEPPLSVPLAIAK